MVARGPATLTFKAKAAEGHATARGDRTQVPVTTGVFAGPKGALAAVSDQGDVVAWSTELDSVPKLVWPLRRPPLRARHVGLGTHPVHIVAARGPPSPLSCGEATDGLLTAPGQGRRGAHAVGPIQNA